MGLPAVKHLTRHTETKRLIASDYPHCTRTLCLPVSLGYVSTIMAIGNGAQERAVSGMGLAVKNGRESPGIGWVGSMPGSNALLEVA
jgi:hypothetical protein